MKEAYVHCVFDEEYIHYDRRSITGVISLGLGEAYFPSMYWNDFIDVLLGWWSDALLKMYEGSESRDCLFMDGSYHFKLRKQPDDRLLELSMYSDQRLMADPCWVLKEDLRGSLMEVINNLVRYIKRKGWDYDVSGWNRLLGALREV